MNKLLFIITFLSISLFSMSQNSKKIDDWEYNQTKVMDTNFISTTMIKSSPVTMAIPAPMIQKSLGFSVGGAKDANNFYDNLKNGYLPKINSITYEGVYHDHYFKMPQQKCRDLFCPNYETAVRKNLFTEKKEYFLSVGLDSNLDITSFKRKKLNLVVVLDISGSMSSPFNRYYYDGKKNEEDSKTSKMKIANRSIVAMIDHLKPQDSFGVVLFDNNSYLAKPLRKVALTDMKAIKKHILELKPRGGTNWSSGYKRGLSLFKDIEKNSQVENRIIFITDAMPNSGELRKDRLFGMIKDASKRGIYTTVIGVGVDFNTDLVESITKTKGANYLSIHSSKEFKKRVDNEFDYLVTPLVFDLKLELISDDFEIKKVYGSATNQNNNKTLLSINTLFPSATNDKGTKGGVVLASLKKIGTHNSLKLKVSYHDRDNNYHDSVKKVTFKDGYYYDGSGIQKAIILTDYVNVIKNFLVDSRKSCNDEVTFASFDTIRQKCLLPPPYPKNSTWERRSCKLEVSKGYKKLFSIFLREFQKQKYLLRDESLKKEEDALKLLLKSSQTQNNKKDDWNFIR